MIDRIIDLPKNHSFFLLGPRQTGKSTLIEKEFTAHIWKVNLLLSDIFIKYSRSPSIFRHEAQEQIQNGVKTIIIDEIQKEPLLLDEVQNLMHLYPQCQFILTGSSARKLKRGGANMLGGRAWMEFLFPLTWIEMGKPPLEDVLQFGSLPSLQSLQKKDWARALKDYTYLYIKEEIQSEGIVRKLGAFNRFLEMAASQNGQLVSYSAIARECFMPIKTVQSYYQVLEDTLIGFKLEPWNKSFRKRMVAHPKFYFFDTGVTNALNNRLSDAIDPFTLGWIFEQFIIIETYRMKHYLKSDRNLYFYRTQTKAEVDLLIEKNGEIKAAIEIKKQKNISSADLTGLRSLKEECPDVPCYVVACVDEPFMIKDIQILPWQNYLENIMKFLPRV